jgi:hypothetical protein
MPTTGSTITLGGATPNFTAYLMPPDIRSITVSATSTTYALCPTIPSDHYFYRSYSNTGLLEQEEKLFNFYTGNPPKFTINRPLTQGPWYMRFSAYRESSGNCGSITGAPSVAVSTWCSSAPNPLSTCCPPDPTLYIGIKNILSAIANISISGGGGPPTSWTDGARHSSLENAGNFLLSGPAIGIRVEMKVLPTGVRVNPGDPDFYWDAGFITPFSMDTPLRGNRLVFRDQSFQLPSVTDQIGYTLLNGTVVDIVELLPVP